MKTNLFISALVVVCFSGCKSQKTEYTPHHINSEQKFEDLLKSLKTGGQPGQISLNGVVVNLDKTLDQRVSIEQSVGASSEKTEISESNKPIFNAELKRKDDHQPTKFETYLNIGCDLKDDSRIAAMTETKNKPNELGQTDTFGVAASMVDKIFICGKVEVSEVVAVLNANEVYLDNVQLSMSMPIGSFSITTDLLSIEGNNLISTQGVSDSTASLLPAPSIKLSVFEKVVGDGHLKLKSAGGDYVAKETR